MILETQELYLEKKIYSTKGNQIFHSFVYSQVIVCFAYLVVSAHHIVQQLGLESGQNRRRSKIWSTTISFAEQHHMSV